MDAHQTIDTIKAALEERRQHGETAFPVELLEGISTHSSRSVVFNRRASGYRLKSTAISGVLR